MVHQVSGSIACWWVLARVAVEEVVEGPSVNRWQWVQWALIVVPCLCFDLRRGGYGQWPVVYSDLLPTCLYSEADEVNVGRAIEEAMQSFPAQVFVSSTDLRCEGMVSLITGMEKHDDATCRTGLRLWLLLPGRSGFAAVSPPGI